MKRDSYETGEVGTFAHPQQKFEIVEALWLRFLGTVREASRNKLKEHSAVYQRRQTIQSKQIHYYRFAGTFDSENQTVGGSTTAVDSPPRKLQGIR